MQKSPPIPLPLAVIGAGNMAEAIVRGLVAGGVLSPADVIAADPTPARREVFAALGTRVVSDNRTAAETARTLLLSTKPQQINAALAEIAPYLSHGTGQAGSVLVLSIAAGVPAGLIGARLEVSEARIVRAMPNTPMLVGQGMTAIAAGPRASPGDLLVARAVFGSAGRVVEVPEELLDAVTAVSGSGPAYFFWLVEQMTRAGVALGLSPEVADLLARQTAIGSAAMLSGGEAPVELRRRVTSPGGTTAAAIDVLQYDGADETFVKALTAARDRGRELANG